MECEAKLEAHLREKGVKYQTMTHPAAYTAQEVAEAQGVKGQQVAKVVMVSADGRMAMLVMPASYRLNFQRVREALGAKEARLATEAEFSHLFPDCETGAMPPFGSLYEVPVYVDRSLTEDEAIVIQAGSHSDTIKIPYQEFARLERPVVADFAVHLP